MERSVLVSSANRSDQNLLYHFYELVSCLTQDRVLRDVGLWGTGYKLERTISGEDPRFFLGGGAPLMNDITDR